MIYKTLAYAFGVFAAFALTSCSDGALGIADETSFLIGSNDEIAGTLTTSYGEETGFKPSVYPLQIRSKLELHQGDGFKLDATISSRDKGSSISFNGTELQTHEGDLSNTSKVRTDEQDLLSTMKGRSEELKASVEKIQSVSAQEWKKILMSSKGAQARELSNGNIELNRSFSNKDGQTVVMNLILDSQKRIPISMSTYLDGELVSNSQLDSKAGKTNHSNHYDGQDSKRPNNPSWK